MCSTTIRSSASLSIYNLSKRRRWMCLFLFISIGLIGTSLIRTVEGRRHQQPKRPVSSESSEEFLNESDVEEFDDFECPEKFGYYPDVGNCSRYHLCDHGKSRLKSCDDGLVFSTILKTCDWPYNVHCNHANGDRGDPSAGRTHLRLGATSGDGENLELSNRRQPVLSNDADDSYWLGRPDTDLLAYLNDEDYHDPYVHVDRDYDIPRRKVQSKPASRPAQPEESGEDSNDSNNNNNNARNNAWLGSAGFENARRRPNINNQPQTRPTTTTTPAAPPVSTNQRGNQGWRTSRPNRPTAPIVPTSPPAEQTLPRRAFRLDEGNEEDYLMTDGPEHAAGRHLSNNDLNDYHRRHPVANQKDDRDSYRIVSHNRPATHPTIATTTTTTTIPTQATTPARVVPWTTPAPQTVAPKLVGSQPRHLGSSYRRKVVRKKVAVTTPAATTPAPTPPPTVPTTPSFRNNVNDFWNTNANGNSNNNDRTDPWKSFRYETINRQQINHNNITIHPPQPQKISSALRRTIPKIEHATATTTTNGRQRFERKPVLRDPEESEEHPEPHALIRGSSDDEDDNNYFYNTPEIIRNRSPGRNLTNNHLHNDDLLPRNVVNDVSNNIAAARFPSNSNNQRQPITPHTVNLNNSLRGNNHQLNKAFDVGFHHAINPNVHHPASHSRNPQFGSAAPPPPPLGPAADIEYEDFENEDEDEDVSDGAINGSSVGTSDELDNVNDNNRNNNNRTPNKEIVVRYDDEDDQIDPRRFPNNNITLNRFVTSNLPSRTIPSANNNRNVASSPSPPQIHFTTSPQPPRYTRFTGENNGLAGGTNSFNSNHLANHSTTKPSAYRILDLTPPEHQPLHHHHYPHAHLPNPVPFVTIIGPLKKSNKTNPFLPIPAAAVLPPPIPPPPAPITFNSLGDGDEWNRNSSPASSAKPKITKKMKPNKKFKADPKPKQTLKQSQSHYTRAKRCIPERCQPPDCRCGGIDIPGGFHPKDTPQIVLLTFDDSVNDLNREIYRRLFEHGRTNPNGCPIAATFYVSHEWTDYSQVQNLYSKGHEIASHSISHSFGEKFSKDRWLDEILGQKEILHLYGGVDAHEIRGMRAPFLQTGGDTMFEMLHQANFSYDSSLPVYDIDPPYWPYTLDYAIGHECMIEPCPANSYPGFWEVGMVMWEDLRGGRCSMADGCFNPPDEDGVYEMVKANFLRHYTSNRAPFGMFFHSRWFLTEHNMNGFIRFLDEMLQLDDIYLVTNWQMIQWMRNPTPLSHIKKFAPFGCDYIRNRPAQCKSPHTCKARFRGEVRTLKTCQACPQSYPWTGNNGNEP